MERRREITGGKRSFILVPGIDVPFHSRVLASRCGGVPAVARPGHAARQGSRRHHRALHPQPGAASVHPGPRLHPGDPRPGAGRAARPDPRRLRHLACRAADRDGPHRPDRAAGMAIRQPGALDRNPGSAVHRRGRRRSGRGAVRRDRCEVRTDRRRAGHQHAQAVRICPQHSRSAQRRARCCGVVRHRHRPRAGARGRAGGARRKCVSTGSGRGRTGGCRRAHRSVGRGPSGRHRVRRRRCHPGADRAVGQDAHRPDRGAGLHRVHHRRRVVATQPAAGGPGFGAEPGRHRRRRRSRPGRAARAGDQIGAHLQALWPSAFRCDQRPAAHGAGALGQAPRRHRRAGQEDLGAGRRLGQARHGRGRAGNPRGNQRPRWCHGPSARGGIGRRRLGRQGDRCRGGFRRRASWHRGDAAVFGRWWRWCDHRRRRIG